jgi:hypothetical protein
VQIVEADLIFLINGPGRPDSEMITYNPGARMLKKVWELGTGCWFVLKPTRKVACAFTR